jgi:hypothetical protein
MEQTRINSSYVRGAGKFPAPVFYFLIKCNEQASHEDLLNWLG